LWLLRVVKRYFGIPRIYTGDLNLERLLERWRQVVQQIEEGYQGPFEEYFNDLDARIILEHDIVASAPRDLQRKIGEALRPFDARFFAATFYNPSFNWRGSFWARVPKKDGAKYDYIRWIDRHLAHQPPS
jgi:hypothetical protein